jgi:hypothetical protein
MDTALETTCNTLTSPTQLPLTLLLPQSLMPDPLSESLLQSLMPNPLSESLLQSLMPNPLSESLLQSLTLDQLELELSMALLQSLTLDQLELELSMALDQLLMAQSVPHLELPTEFTELAQPFMVEFMEELTTDSIKFSH